MRFEHMDAAQKAARGRKVAIGRFLAIINAADDKPTPDEDSVQKTSPIGDCVKISFEDDPRNQLWRPLLDILPLAPQQS